MRVLIEYFPSSVLPSLIGTAGRISRVLFGYAMYNTFTVDINAGASIIESETDSQP